MYILGINTGLNSSAVLLKNNRVVYGVQEERLSRVKNQPGFPELSIKAALAHAGLKAADIDQICVGGVTSKVTKSRQDDLEKFHKRYGEIKRKWFGETENPFAELARRGLRKLSGLGAASTDKELELEDYLKEFGLLDKHTRFDHHSCHAAASYYGLAQNQEEKHLVFSMDGGGDGRTSAVFVGQNGKLEEIASSDSFSPACLYAHITYILGFMPHEHEYKLMGLAPYAQRKYAEVARDALYEFIGFDPANPMVFNNTAKYAGVRNSKGQDKQRLIEDLFRSVLSMRFDTLSAGLQLLAEEVAIAWVKAGVAATGIKKVLLAGGFFMNVKANKLISELPGLEYVNCFPSCGDETNAFGAAFLGYHKFKAAGAPPIEFGDFCVGPEAGTDLEEARKRYAKEVEFTRCDDINGEVVKLLRAGKIVARCSGRMEFGARSLGNRSIIASPDDFRIIQKINSAIKKRDFWMPFAPAALQSHAEELMEIPSTLKHAYSPYMMFTFDVKPEAADKIIAGVHQADKTARAQLVAPEIYPLFHDLISRFHAASGIPSVLNTSFNLHGFPIVTGTVEAIDVYLNSELDVLVVNDHLITRKNA